MLKAERNAAQKKVAAGRGTLRTAVVDLDYEGKYVPSTERLSLH